MILSSAPFKLRDKVKSLFAGIRQKAVDKHQKLIVHYNVQSPDSFVGDSRRLIQVLDNLLSNAINFSGDNVHIELGIDEISRDEEKATIRFSVADNGAGIPKGSIEKLFCHLEPSDNNGSQHRDGTDQGLVVSQRIVELMGGCIQVESQKDNGSRFFFSVGLDLEKVVNSKVEPVLADRRPEKYDFSGRRILVVDDVEVNREIVCAFLNSTGVKLENASNGQEAVDMMAASPAGYYDVVLMDVQMPVVDGCEATRRIRALNRQDAKTIVILALTASTFDEDIKQVLEAGMNSHIAKPVEYESILQAIHDVLPSAGMDTPGAS